MAAISSVAGLLPSVAQPLLRFIKAAHPADVRQLHTALLNAEELLGTAPGALSLFHRADAFDPVTRTVIFGSAVKDLNKVRSSLTAARASVDQAMIGEATLGREIDRIGTQLDGYLVGLNRQGDDLAELIAIRTSAAGRAAPEATKALNREFVAAADEAFASYAYGGAKEGVKALGDELLGLRSDVSRLLSAWK